jgi:hypothetical protein
MNLRLPLILICCLLGFGFLVNIATAQVSKTLNGVNYDVETGGAFATEKQTPFWLRTNQYGVVPLKSPFFTLRAGLHRDYNTKTDTTQSQKTTFDWGVGVSSSLNLSPSTSQLLWPEVYAKIKLGQFEIYGGRRRELIGLGDSTLSSGFMAWSGNALPFPKIQFQTIDFFPLKFIKSILSFKASYAHGWFTAPYITGTYLHQKTLYLRLGKPHWSFRFYAGLNHQVQWGGKADYLVGSPVAENGQLPATFRDYISLIMGRYPEDYSNNRYNSFDGANRIGNHLGSYDFALEWRKTQQTLLFYHQHPYEDASGLAFQNFPDGLTGISWLRSLDLSSQSLVLHKLVLEYLSTTNQSGEVYNTLSQYQGSDSYFNHGQYKEGWSYFNHTIGTPFIAPRTTLQTDIQLLSNSNFFPNNRVKMGYLGIEWLVLKQTIFQSRASFSRNYGYFGSSPVTPVNQFSCLFSVQTQPSRWHGLMISTSLAFDQGSLFPSVWGSYVSLKKKW